MLCILSGCTAPVNLTVQPLSALPFDFFPPRFLLRRKVSSCDFSDLEYRENVFVILVVVKLLRLLSWKEKRKLLCILIHCMPWLGIEYVSTELAM